jgi:GntR family transcriptional regulator/MocR family aminotransferase
MGVALTPARRLALLAWAAANRSWILEDDYDSEFRYGSRPLPALKGLDEADRVLYVGTFSKVLFPGLRLAYLVVPEPEVKAVGRVCEFLHRGNFLLPQQVVSDFMAEGRFPRHIGRMRLLYAGRREALAAALIKEFGTKIDVSLEAGGMHLLARLNGKGTDVEWAMSASAVGLAPAPLSAWCINESEQGLLISFTNASREACPSLAHLLKQALQRYL